MSRPANALRSRHLLAGLLLLAWFGATAGVRPLLLPDEGRYAGVAWEMLRSGDWLTPTLDGLPFFHKPPLFYWITAGALSIFGVNEWAARAASILGAALGTMALYLFVRRWSGERLATLAAVALAVQPLQFLGGQFANLDMLVAGLITATVLLCAQAILSSEAGQPHRIALLLACASAALGVLAKGLIAIVLPALVMLSWLALRRRLGSVKRLLSVAGVLVFAAIAFPWFVAMQWRFDDFFDYFFVFQHFKRYAGTGFNNVQPFWFFPVVLAIFSLPWLPWWVVAARRRGDPSPNQHAVRQLMLVWIAVVLVFFSVPRSKLLGYILPLVPPLAYLVAEALHTLVSPSSRARLLWVASAALSAAISIGAVFVGAAQLQYTTRDFGTLLREMRGPRDAVFMLGQYFYDVPFYARLQLPIGVVDQWSRADLRQVDNWRKELADGASFLPDAARQRLLDTAELPLALCAAPVSWVLGRTRSRDAIAYLASATVVHERNGTTLWKVERSEPTLAAALACPPPAADGYAEPVVR
jgi:4-amino-4-deoxy-L-arabinose transferase-like glycosyltransferase